MDTSYCVTSAGMLFYGMKSHDPNKTAVRIWDLLCTLVGFSTYRGRPFPHSQAGKDLHFDLTI